MKARIVGVLSQVLAIPESSIGDDFGQRDCPEWDSLRTVDLLFALETEFGTEFDEADAGTMTSLSSILRVVAAKLG